MTQGNLMPGPLIEVLPADRCLVPRPLAQQKLVLP